ncbi:MAG TPA: response regulator [Actinomycetota bacterium]|nr:response regulator [Actinomycetota bacterium]
MRDNEHIKKARIVIVDDQEPNVRLLERLLAQAGYHNTVGTTDPTAVVGLFDECEPDLILLDLLMPGMDGFAVMQELTKRVGESTYLPILVLTADVTSEAKLRALSMGARDYLTKPFDHAEALLRIRNLLETRVLHLQLRDQNEYLEERVRERTIELQEKLEGATRAAEHRRMLLSQLAVEQAATWGEKAANE